MSEKIIVTWRRLITMTEWKATYHEIPQPPGFVSAGRAYHVMMIDFEGNLVARGTTCCGTRQYGCAYLGTCRAQRPADIPLGKITDYPEVESAN